LIAWLSWRIAATTIPAGISPIAWRASCQALGALDEMSEVGGDARNAVAVKTFFASWAS
jgi:hypothetical protein